MIVMPLLVDTDVEPLGRDEPTFRVVLSASATQRLAGIHKVIERNRGDLRRLYRMTRRGLPQILLHLGARRIDDVLTGLEAAGFDVTAVVATPGRAA